ncbi:Protein CYR61, partial [Stegodyphus mimosarum]
MDASCHTTGHRLIKLLNGLLRHFLPNWLQLSGWVGTLLWAFPDASSMIVMTQLEAGFVAKDYTSQVSNIPTPSSQASLQTGSIVCMCIFPVILIILGLGLVLSSSDALYTWQPTSGGVMMIDDRSFRCPETCRCPETYPQCQDGVPVVIDGCGCCPVCARQQGDICNSVQVCDVTRKLQCIYADPFTTSGICRGKR